MLYPLSYERVMAIVRMEARARASDAGLPQKITLPEAEQPIAGDK